MSDRAIVMLVLFAPTFACVVAIFVGWMNAERRFTGGLAMTGKVVALLTPFWLPWLLTKLPGVNDPSRTLAFALWIGVPLVLMANAWPIFFSGIGALRRRLAFGGYLFVCMPTILFNALAYACMLDPHGCH